MIGNILLLIFSIIVYASLGLQNLIFILFSALSSFYAAKYMYKNKKVIFLFTVIINLIILVFFKVISYHDFTGLRLIIPLGISYYSFQIIGYLIDVYNEKYKAEKNLYKYLLFVLYIPYLFTGPINRYDQLKHEFAKTRKITKDNLFNGLIRVFWGLFKVYVVAGHINIIISTIASNTSVYYGAYVLCALILYSFLLYCDFSGSIDIVIGFSKILNITLLENFDSPYLAENLKEFWHRWHISLSTWFRDYVYIPLGGSRCSKIRNKINILITFTLSGLWHGINYIFWGLLHGLILAITQNKKTKFKWLNIFINFTVVSLLWIFFIYSNSLESFKMLGSIFYSFNYGELFSNIFNLGLSKIDFIVMNISIVIVILFDIKKEFIRNKIYNYKIDKKLIIILTLLLLVLLFGIYGLDFVKNNFIYSGF